MSFSHQSPSSFTPYKEPKSPNLLPSEFDFHEFSRLSLNSHENENDSSGNQSLRSNASLALKPLPSLQIFDSQQRRSYDLLSMRSRNRKKSIEIGIRPSQPGNMTFLNNSFVGKSQLHLNEDFNFAEPYDLVLEKSLSQKSCPAVRNQEYFTEIQKAYGHNDDIDGFIDRNKICKKFKKTKNYLRTLSSYLHKHIKYCKKAKNFVIEYYIKKRKAESMDDLNNQQLNFEANEYFAGLVEWVNTLNMINFIEYQKAWTTENKYLSIYRQLSYKYYLEQAFCDIQKSRLTSKEIIQQYIPQFIEGLLNPKQFTHFKNQ